MKQLSGGMKQKLGLICTLIRAELAILDEPTTVSTRVAPRFRAIRGMVGEGHDRVCLDRLRDEAVRFHRLSFSP